MAGVRWSVQVGHPLTTTNTAAAVIATSAAIKTILQVAAAANHALLIKEWSVSFRGIVTTGTPILVEIVRQTGGGFVLDSAPTEISVKKLGDDTETLQVTAQADSNSEPVRLDVLFAEYVHPQTGYTWQAPFGGGIKVPGSGKLGLSVTADVSVFVVARFAGEE